jgi:hypothetical protein
MLVEVATEFIEHALPEEEARTAAEAIIVGFAKHHGVKLGRVSVDQRDENGKLIEAQEVSRIPGESQFLSIVRPGEFSLIVKAPLNEGQVTLDYMPTQGLSLHYSVEARQEVCGAVNKRLSSPLGLMV